MIYRKDMQECACYNIAQCITAESKIMAKCMKHDGKQQMLGEIPKNSLKRYRNNCKEINEMKEEYILHKLVRKMAAWNKDSKLI